jgi:hypothetical protein
MSVFILPISELRVLPYQPFVDNLSSLLLPEKMLTHSSMEVTGFEIHFPAVTTTYCTVSKSERGIPPNWLHVYYFELTLGTGSTDAYVQRLCTDR